MVQIATLLLAGPLGFFCRSRKKGLVIWLVAVAVLLPIQTILVLPDDDEPVAYLLVQVLTLAVGIGLNALGARLRARRAGLAPGSST
jgi:hypothetical protein